MKYIILIIIFLFISCGPTTDLQDGSVPLRPFIIIERDFHYQNDCARVFSYRARTSNGLFVSWVDDNEYMIGDTLR